MQQRGWTQTSGGWKGPYATKRGTWHGQIDNAGGGAFRVFICRPPAQLQRHPKWPCCAPYGSADWYTVHLQVPPHDRDPNAIVRYIEQILTESFKL